MVGLFYYVNKQRIKDEVFFNDLRNAKKINKSTPNGAKNYSKSRNYTPDDIPHTKRNNFSTSSNNAKHSPKSFLKDADDDFTANIIDSSDCDTSSSDD